MSMPLARRGRWLFRAAYVLITLCSVLIASSAFAQLGSGQLEGTVTDPSGAVVAKAPITVANEATGARRSLESNERGEYRAVSLEPGTYLVTVEKAGFRKLQRRVVVSVGSTTTADMALTMGSAGETIEVSGAAPLIQTEKSDVSYTISNQVEENLPVTGRRWENFVMLAPAVSSDGTFGLVSYRGISGLYNNNALDGMDNNQAFFSEARGRDRVVYTYSQAAIKEFQVGVSTPTAEFGRAAGGSVNAVTKSGENTFHGQGFYFIRDSATSARDPFVDQNVLENSIGDTKLPERRQQFGLAMGGPIVKDKLFWFASWDQQVRNFPYVVSTSSDYATFFGAPIATGADCAILPTANQRGTCAWMFDQLTMVPRKGLNEVGMGKLDWVVNAAHSMSGYANIQRWRSVNGIRTPAINFNAESDNGYNKVRTDTVHYQWTWIVSPTMLNEFRFSYTNDRDMQNPNAPGPGTSVTGGFSFGQPDFLPRARYPFERRLQFSDGFSKVAGQHTFKFGLDLNFVREDLQNLFQGGAVYSYSNFASLAGDCPAGARVAPYNCVPDGTLSYSSFNEAFDLRVIRGEVDPSQAGAAKFNTTDWNFYAQDTWKLRPDLTLNLGLRYEYQQLPEVQNANPAFPFTQSLHADKNNFAPRLGVAWDVFGKHKTVINAGYGLMYGRTSNSTLFSALMENGFNFTTLSLRTGDAGAPTYPDCFLPGVNSTCALPTPTIPSATFKPDVFQLAPDYVRPMVHSANFGIEHELYKDVRVSATYVYSGGRRLPAYVDLNMPEAGSEAFVYVDTSLQVNDRVLVPAGVYGPIPFYCVSNADAPVGNCSNTGTRPDTTIRRLMTAESVINTNYHGLILRASKRMSHGILFDTHYTWAHALDNGQNSTTFFSRSTTFFDPFDPNVEYGRSNTDVRQRWVMSWVWEPQGMFNFQSKTARSLLGDWRVSGSATANTGKPVSPFVSGFLNTNASRAVDTGSLNGSGGTFRFPFVQKNSFDMPGYASMDLRLGRTVRLTESKHLDFLVEAFNIFNRKNVTTVDTTALKVVSTSKTVATCGGETITLGDRCIKITPNGLVAGDQNSSFLNGRSASSTLTNMREFQFAAKFYW